MTNPQKITQTLAAIMQFKQKYDTGTLEPDMAKTPLCMHQYQYMFSTRIPGEVVDTVVKSTGDYFIVMRKGRVFKIPCGDGTPLSLQRVEQQVSWCYTVNEEGEGVGLLTTENRDAWYGARTALLECTDNQQVLKCIEDALFVVCLDKAGALTTEEKSRQYWHGSGVDRWFDKSLQFVLGDDGKMGFCGEHSFDYNFKYLS